MIETADRKITSVEGRPLLTIQALTVVPCHESSIDSGERSPTPNSLSASSCAHVRRALRCFAPS